MTVAALLHGNSGFVTAFYRSFFITIIKSSGDFFNSSFMPLSKESCA